MSCSLTTCSVGTFNGYMKVMQKGRKMALLISAVPLQAPPLLVAC